jgi:hypothetical protein
MLNSGSRPYYWAAFVLDGEPTAVRLLTSAFLERDLEDVILRELQIFLPELGIRVFFRRPAKTYTARWRRLLHRPVVLLMGPGKTDPKHMLVLDQI